MSPAILTIIIFFLCILSFIWEKIPLAVTCLLGGIALALLGIIDYVDIYSNMGTQVVAIVIGTSMVGLGIRRNLGHGRERTSQDGNCQK